MVEVGPELAARLDAEMEMSWEQVVAAGMKFVIARSEAIQSHKPSLDCFAEPGIGPAFARPVGSQ